MCACPWVSMCKKNRMCVQKHKHPISHTSAHCHRQKQSHNHTRAHTMQDRHCCPIGSRESSQKYKVSKKNNHTQNPAAQQLSHFHSQAWDASLTTTLPQNKKTQKINQ